MGTGPVDLVAAGGGSRLRAGDDDRDRVMDLLKTAFMEGRLTREELDVRAGQALAARTYAQLDALTEDIPAISGPDDPPGSSAPGQGRWRLARASAISVGCLALAFVAAYSGNLIDNAWHGPGPGPEHGWTRLLLFLAVTAVIMAFIVMGHAVVTTLEEGNSRGTSSLPGCGHFGSSCVLTLIDLGIRLCAILKLASIDLQLPSSSSAS